MYGLAGAGHGSALASAWRGWAVGTQPLTRSATSPDRGTVSASWTARWPPGGHRAVHEADTVPRSGDVADRVSGWVPTAHPRHAEARALPCPAPASPYICPHDGHRP